MCHVHTERHPMAAWRSSSQRAVLAIECRSLNDWIHIFTRWPHVPVVYSVFCHDFLCHDRPVLGIIILLQSLAIGEKQAHLESNWWIVYMAFLASTFWRLAHLPSLGWVFYVLGCWKRPIHFFYVDASFPSIFFAVKSARAYIRAPTWLHASPLLKQEKSKLRTNPTHTLYVYKPWINTTYFWERVLNGEEF